MDPVEYFRSPSNPMQIRYEALRAFFYEGMTAEEVADRFNISPNTVYTLSRDFKQGTLTTFFAELRKGPKGPVKLSEPATQRMIALRKQNLSVDEIKEALEREGFQGVADKTIRDVLKKEGFTRLFRRTRAERRTYLQASREPTEVADVNLFGDHKRTRTQYGGAFLFLPTILDLRLHQLFDGSGFYGSNAIPRMQYLLSYLALKLVGKERLSHIDDLNFDYGLAMLAGLNVLPKAAAITQYSYRHSPNKIKDFLKGFVKVMSEQGLLPGNVINLDFHSIPHWGEDSQLERHWVPTRGKTMKSILSFFAQDMESTYLCYSNGDVTKSDVADEVMKFVEFYKTTVGRKPECLVFDSKVTTYANLHALNQDDIQFITLRRRSPSLLAEIDNVRQWKKTRLDVPKRRYKSLKYYEKQAEITDYEGSIRQIFVTGTGRELPMIVITNDFNSSVKEILLKYAKRWRVENNIQENVDFFSLNALSSPVVVKVDFDIAMTLVANTLFKLMARKFERFETAKPKTIFRNIIEGKAEAKLYAKKVVVRFGKQAYNPMIKAWIETQPVISVPWWGDRTLHFEFE